MSRRPRILPDFPREIVLRVNDRIEIREFLTSQRNMIRETSGVEPTWEQIVENLIMQTIAERPEPAIEAELRSAVFAKWSRFIRQEIDLKLQEIRRTIAETPSQAKEGE